MILHQAIDADQRGELQLAASCYEDVLASGDTSLQVLLNLAVLYWQATDPGIAAAKHLSPVFLATAGSRVPELLADAQKRYPWSTEARFWQRYIAWADMGEPFTAEECRELLREDLATLVPAMHIFALSQGKEAVAEAGELLRSSCQDGTTKLKYIVSVIEGVMKRRRPDSSPGDGRVAD